MSDWPLGLCSDDGRKAIELPFRVGDETVCTDGKVLVAIPGTIDSPMGEGPPKEIMASILGTPMEDPATFDLAALRAWCGPEVEECPCRESGDVCKACGGSGEVACECDCGHQHRAACDECFCDHCDAGSLNRATVDKVAAFGKTHLNVRLLAALLDGAPGATVQIGRRADPEQFVPIVGEGWRGVIMPVRFFAPPESLVGSLDDLLAPARTPTPDSQPDA